MRFSDVSFSCFGHLYVDHPIRVLERNSVTNTLRRNYSPYVGGAEIVENKIDSISQ